jgi:hypothetical protein
MLVLGYKSVSFAPAITANVLIYFIEKRIENIFLKRKKRFARNKRRYYICRPEREQVLRQIE